MCLICVEFNKKKMTRDEMLRALPEMIMFANSDEDKAHFKRLLKLDGSELDLEVETHVAKLQNSKKKDDKKKT